MSTISLLTPQAALVALLGSVPLAVFLGRRRRARRVRETLGLGEPSARADAVTAAALAAVAVLVGGAAAQPVVDSTQPLRERTDAEVFFALDTSRSMLAARAPGARTRFERARDAAIAIRSRLPEVPAGLAQFTDWTVPHLFPTVDATTFATVLERSLYVDSLGSRGTDVVATDLDALASFAGESYFSPGVGRRLLVVLTDGESEAFGARLVPLRDAGIRTIFVRVWGPDESMWAPRGAEPEYRPDPGSAAALARAGRLADGSVADVREVEPVVRAARSYLGAGPTRPREQRRDLLALMPLLTLGVLVPLFAVLRARNL